MIENESLTREELIEAAELEVLGLLDEVDLARFTRAFDGATPALQAEVIAAQEALANEPLFQSQELPSAALRLRTIAGVLDAMESEAKAAAPIATIGPGRTLATSTRQGQFGLQFGQQGTMSPDAMRALIADLAARTHETKAPGQLAWRAASFLLLAALAVSMYFNSRLAEVSNKLVDAATSEAIKDEVAKFALSVSDFSFASCTHTDLRRVGTMSAGHVSVFVDPNQERLAVVGLGFKPNELVTIQVRDANGLVLFSEQIRGRNTGFGELCELPAGVLSRGVIEVYTNDNDGNLTLAFTQA